MLHKARSILLGASFLLLCTTTACATTLLSPLGRWQTIDDETGQPRSVVRLFEQQGILQGKIESVYYRAGETTNEVCSKCQGLQHNQPVIGLNFLWGLTQNNVYSWDNGSILDPHNGRIYHCSLVVAKDGKTLTVRGYLGLPLFGRTQTWLRIAAKN